MPSRLQPLQQPATPAAAVCLHPSLRPRASAFRRVAVKFKLTVPENVDGIALDPEPDWSFDALLLELNSIERKITASPKFPAYTKMQPRDLSTSKSGARTGFVMQVDEIVSDSEDEVSEQSATVGKRFNFDELYTSDSDISKDQSAFEAEHHLMDKVGLVEGALSELTHDHHLSVTEEVRTQILALETDLIGEKQKFASTLATVVKNAETQQEMDRRLGMQYQRKIAEALDDHLIAVQRDHEHRSQIEERRIRDDAAREEAKKREKALQEEKARLEKVRAEAEMQAKLEAERIEKAKVAELEAQRKAAEEAAEKKASENVKNNTADAPEVVNKVSGQAVELGSDVQNSLQSRGKIVKGAENALNLEEKRLKIYKELAVKNETLGLGSKREYETHKSDMRRRIRTISGVKENISVKADELIKLINYSPCPQSISIAMFAEQVVSWCVSRAGNSNSIPYAYGRVIVLVTSKVTSSYYCLQDKDAEVPVAMDILIAELNKVCIYTVPKHISYSQSVFKTKEAYYRAIGFQDDGKIETVDSYLNRLCAYMKLYGALVQTEVEGFQNLHGHREGWAWLARFLNAVPANLYTATALQAFLEMAGFVLYRKYKYHFEKLLNIIAKDFMKAIEDLQSSPVTTRLRSYIESKQYLNEPEGWRLKTSLDSSYFVPDG
nr:protein GLE1 isoform X2 [Ipomoea batatas]